MLGVCFDDVGKVSLHEISNPVVEQPGDAIVQVELAGLCGSDLHVFWGRELGMDPGTVMGHEFVGKIVEVGDDVGTHQIGDRVCAPFTTNCGKCFFCRKGLTARCQSGQLFGWRSNGAGLHGGQSERVRVPLADGTLVKVDDAIPVEVSLLIGDNLSTGYFCAQLAEVDAEGIYLVIGCGTVGLLCLAACRAMGAENLMAFDLNPIRLQQANHLGVETYSDETELRAAIQSRSQGRGADAVMELVGMPEAARLAFELVRPGGIMSVIGCHCTPNFAFGPVEAYDKNLTYRTGRCPARSLMPTVTELFQADFDWLRNLVTHRFKPQMRTGLRHFF